MEHLILETPTERILLRQKEPQLLDITVHKKWLIHLLWILDVKLGRKKDNWKLKILRKRQVLLDMIGKHSSKKINMKRKDLLVGRRLRIWSRRSWVEIQDQGNINRRIWTLNIPLRDVPLRKLKEQPLLMKYRIIKKEFQPSMERKAIYSTARSIEQVLPPFLEAQGEDHSTKTKTLQAHLLMKPIGLKSWINNLLFHAQRVQVRMNSLKMWNPITLALDIMMRKSNSSNNPREIV